MFVRRLVFSLFLGAVVAGSTVGAAGAGGFTTTGTIPAVPPVLSVPLPATCNINVNFVTQVTEYNCEATAPNPDPPKGRTSVKFTMSSPKGSCKTTAWPDGSVKMACRFKGLLL